MTITFNKALELEKFLNKAKVLRGEGFYETEEGREAKFKGTVNFFEDIDNRIRPENKHKDYVVYIHRSSEIIIEKD